MSRVDESDLVQDGGDDEDGEKEVADLVVSIVLRVSSHQAENDPGEKLMREVGVGVLTVVPNQRHEERSNACRPRGLHEDI